MGKANIMDLMKERSRAAGDKMEIIYKDITELEPSEGNFYSTENIKGLKSSIEALGILQPLLIRKENGKDVVKSGHRRRLAVLELLKEPGHERLQRVPCIYVKNELAEQDAEDPIWQMILIQANNFREKSEYEKMTEVMQMEKLVESLKKSEKIPGRTRDLLRDATGIKTTKLAQYHKIANNLIPEIMDCFRGNLLNISIVDRLASLSKEHQQQAFESGLNVDEVERLEKLEKAEEENVPGQMNFEDAFEVIFKESSEVQSVSAVNIITGEMQQIPEAQNRNFTGENPAKSSLTDMGKVSSGEELKKKLRNGKCITGYSPYGNCICCNHDGVQCCAACKESCNSRCGWIPEEKKPSQVKEAPKSTEEHRIISPSQQEKSLYSRMYVTVTGTMNIKNGDIPAIVSSLKAQYGDRQICNSQLNFIADKIGIVFNPETSGEKNITWQKLAENIVERYKRELERKQAEEKESDSDTLSVEQQLPEFYRRLSDRTKDLIKRGMVGTVTIALREEHANHSFCSDKLQFDGRFDGIIFNHLSDHPEKMTWSALKSALIQYYTENKAELEVNAAETEAEPAETAAKTQQEKRYWGIKEVREALRKAQTDLIAAHETDLDRHLPFVMNAEMKEAAFKLLLEQMEMELEMEEAE